MLYGLISILVTVFLPCFIFFFIAVKKEGGAKVFMWGGMTYVVFVGILQSALINVLSKSFAIETANPLLYNCLIAVLSALLLALGTYFAARRLSKNEKGFESGAVFGLGVGCTEALLLVGVHTVMQIANAGALNALGPMLLAAAIERVSATMVHVLLAVATVYGVKTKRMQHVVVGLLGEVAFNVAGVALVQFNVSPFILESLLLVLSAGLWVLALRYKERFNQ